MKQPPPPPPLEGSAAAPVPVDAAVLAGSDVVGPVLPELPVASIAVKVAPTLSLLLIVTRQVWLVPEQAPDHPVKVEPPLAIAVSVTDVPEANVVPLGLVVTEPVPVPVSVRVRV